MFVKEEEEVLEREGGSEQCRNKQTACNYMAVELPAKCDADCE